MSPLLVPYLSALWALALLLLLVLVQFAVADVARIRAKQTPGVAVQGDHSIFTFRAERAHANTIENLSAFVAATILAILTSAEASHVNALAIAFVAARAAHMACYYLDKRILRSVAFAIGMIATGLMAVTLIRQLASA